MLERGEAELECFGGGALEPRVGEEARPSGTHFHEEGEMCEVFTGRCRR